MTATATRTPAGADRPDAGRDHRLVVAGWVAAAVFLVSTALAAAGEPPGWELALFEAVNHLPDQLYWVIWPFMQYGVFVTIPVVATVALLRYRRRLAALLAVSGVGIYVAAKVVKEVADRGRPGAYVTAVEAREHFSAGSLGFTSGHAAVAATIATITVAHLGRPWRQLSVALVGLVAFGRMYVGAHLPLDLVGGVAMGVATGAAATYWFGTARAGREEGPVMAGTVATPGGSEPTATGHHPAAPGPEPGAGATPPPPARRHPGDALRVVLGLVVIAVGLLAVQRDRLTTFEADLFRLLNRLPSQIAPVVEVVMQAGNVAAAPVAGLALLLVVRRWRVVVDVTLAGGLAWIAAKVVKDLVGRPRPTGFFEEVARFSTEGLGFVSGHTAVAAAIATAAGPYLARRWRRALWALPWLVGFTRIYFGAHLPLDVVGGAALGWALGAAVHLVLGAPHRVPGLEEAAGVLRRAGHRVDDLRRVPGMPQGSFPFVARAGGRTTFVKLLDPEPRDRDLLYRGARLLAFREVRDEAALLDPSALAHREVAMGLLARTGGARVPAVSGIEEDRDRVWVVQEHVEGVDLDHLDPSARTDEVLRDAWRQVAHTHAARVAHRDLVTTNVVVDGAGRAWLVDFAHAISAAPPRALDNDVAELLASTALLVGPGRSVAAALDVLGPDALAAALAELQPLALTAGTRRHLQRRADVLPTLRAEVARAGGAAPVLEDAAPRGLAARWSLVPALAAVAVLVVVAGPADVGLALNDPAPRWLGLAVLAAVAARISGGARLVAALGHRAAVLRVAADQLVAAPAAVTRGRWAGEVALLQRLRRTGLAPAAARPALHRDRAWSLGAALAVGAAALAAAAVRGTSLAVPREVGWWAGLAVAVGLVQLAGARRRLDHDPDGQPTTPAGDRRSLDHDPDGQPTTPAGDRRRPTPANRVPLALGAGGAAVAASVAAVAVVAAVGGGAPVAGVLVVHAVVTVLGLVGPVPGAPGTGEALTAGGLVALGMPVVPAVAAALATRALAVWIPVLVGLALEEPVREDAG